jgi:GT2 family glycosyltransferase
VRELLQDCLASVRESRLPGLDVVVTVVDNDSGDGSAEMVEECFPEFSLIRSENLGYPYANNLGFARRNARYQLMLNPDTLLPPSALAETVRYMDEHPDVGALGPRLVLADGSLDLACRRGFPTPLNAFAKYSGLSRLFPRSRRLGSYNLTYLNPDETADVGSLVGAFMLLRGEALEQIGGLDQTFFMYGEDLDLCFRLASLGWRVVYWPGVTVLHYKRASSSQSTRASREFFRAMRIFYDKHYSDGVLPLRRTAVSAGIGLIERFVGYGPGATK